ncbi:MAG: alkaline shock response membrane anchor protein AmaP [Bacillota bacterium]|jgi:uncharacterized alkaline shock family protein YloU
MNVLRRILLILWSLFLVIIGIVMVGCLTNATIAQYWQNVLQDFFFGQYNFFIAMLIAAAFIIVGVFSLIVAFHYKRKDTLVPISNAEYGQVNISMQAIDSIVRKSVTNIEEVKEVRTQIKAVPEGVALFLGVSVPHEINVPELSSRLQNEVKSYLEAITGLRVAEVKVLIGNIIPDNTIKTNASPGMKME